MKLQAQKDIFYLINKYSDSIPRIEAEILLSYIFKCPRSVLYADYIVIDEETERIYGSLAERRLAGEPLQYITGLVKFAEMDFLVNKDVFIPRPETEILIEGAVSAVHQLSAKHSLRILDLCTGSGNIAVSLARLIPSSEIHAVDISESALSMARKNASIYNVDKDVRFHCADIFKGLPFDKKYKFDIIVCNPPYIRSGEIDGLQEEVRREPKIALDGGIDGLDFYRHLEEITPEYLKKQGSLFLETGIGQSGAVIGIFKRRGLFDRHKIIKDLSGIDRVLWINLS